MRLRIFLAACLFLIVFSYWRSVRRPEEAPPPAEALVSPNDRLIQERPDLMPEQVAVLLLKPDEQALPIARTLEPVGIPFTVTREPSIAFAHRLVFIPFGEQSFRLTEQFRRSLEDYARRGGTLVLQPPPGNTWAWLTGVRSANPKRTRKRLSFRLLADPIFSALTEPEEQWVSLSAAKTADAPWTQGLRLSPELDAVTVADFPETRDAAISRRRLGAGWVYVFGFDLRDVVVRDQAQRHFDAARVAANGFEPGADVFSLIWAGLYRQANPVWARLRPAPGLGPLWLMTHSVEQGASLAQLKEFSELEASRSVQATWFLEHPDAPFFDRRARDLAASLTKAGQEAASHGVSHGSDFAQLPFGDAGAKEYRPETDEEGRTAGATLVGETTVSKRLLEKALGDKAVKGFRVPGYAYPPALDEALELGGYSYDSSLVANNCLTNFPFRLVRHRALTAESPVVEFPVTFADELAEGALPDAAAMLKTARRISAYGGAVVWEIHPNGQAGQRERLEAVLSGAPPGTHWMSMSEAARFWNRRAAARFSFVSSGAKRLRLKISAPEGVGGLSFQLSGRAKNCSSKIGAVCRGDILLIPSSVQAKEAEVTVNFE